MTEYSKSSPTNPYYLQAASEEIAVNEEPVEASAAKNVDPEMIAQLVQREKQEMQAWLDRLRTLTKQEHAVFHWYVTCRCSWKQVCRELGLENRDHFDWLCGEIKKKLEVSIVQLRKERDAQEQALAAKT